MYETRYNVSSPAIVPADAPHAYGVYGLRVQRGEALRVDQLERAVVQVHEQVLALEGKYIDKRILLTSLNTIQMYTRTMQLLGDIANSRLKK